MHPISWAGFILFFLLGFLGCGGYKSATAGGSSRSSKSKCAMSKENKRGIKLFFLNKNDQKKNFFLFFFGNKYIFMGGNPLLLFLSRIVSRVYQTWGPSSSSLRIVKMCKRQSRGGGNGQQKNGTDRKEKKKKKMPRVYRPSFFFIVVYLGLYTLLVGGGVVRWKREGGYRHNIG